MVKRIELNSRFGSAYHLPRQLLSPPKIRKPPPPQSVLKKRVQPRVYVPMQSPSPSMQDLLETRDSQSDTTVKKGFSDLEGEKKKRENDIKIINDQAFDDAAKNFLNTYPSQEEEEESVTPMNPPPYQDPKKAKAELVNVLKAVEKPVKRISKKKILKSKEKKINKKKPPIHFPLSSPRTSK